MDGCRGGGGYGAARKVRPWQTVAAAQWCRLWWHTTQTTRAVTSLQKLQPAALQLVLRVVHGGSCSTAHIERLTILVICRWTRRGLCAHSRSLRFSLSAFGGRPSRTEACGPNCVRHLSSGALRSLCPFRKEDASSILELFGCDEEQSIQYRAIKHRFKGVQGRPQSDSRRPAACADCHDCQRYHPHDPPGQSIACPPASTTANELVVQAVRRREQVRCIHHCRVRSERRAVLTENR